MYNAKCSNNSVILKIQHKLHSKTAKIFAKVENKIYYRSPKWYEVHVVLSTGIMVFWNVTP